LLPVFSFPETQRYHIETMPFTIPTAVLVKMFDLAPKAFTALILIGYGVKDFSEQSMLFQERLLQNHIEIIIFRYRVVRVQKHDVQVLSPTCHQAQKKVAARPSAVVGGSDRVDQ
jgi:hypothetical protein